MFPVILGERWKGGQGVLHQMASIVEYLPIAQATVSQHLKALRDAGWVVGNVEGPARCYCLDAENIAWFREQIGRIF